MLLVVVRRPHLRERRSRTLEKIVGKLVEAKVVCVISVERRVLAARQDLVLILRSAKMPHAQEATVASATSVYSPHIHLHLQSARNCQRDTPAAAMDARIAVIVHLGFSAAPVRECAWTGARGRQEAGIVTVAVKANEKLSQECQHVVVVRGLTTKTVTKIHQYQLLDVYKA